MTPSAPSRGRWRGSEEARMPWLTVLIVAGAWLLLLLLTVGYLLLTRERSDGEEEG